MAVLISCIRCGLDCLIFPGKRLSPVKAGVLNIVVWLLKYSCKAVYRSRSKLFLITSLSLLIEKEFMEPNLNMALFPASSLVCSK